MPDKWRIYDMSLKLIMADVVDKIYITMIYKPYLIVYIQDLILEVEDILNSSWLYVTKLGQKRYKMKFTLGHDIELTKEA